jgi:isopentenyl phosphate kinase
MEIRHAYNFFSLKFSMNKKITVLKIGGSLITDKQGSVPAINKDALERICKEIGEAYSEIKESEGLFIIHGAGSYGHLIVKRSGIDEGIKTDQNLMDFAQTQKMQNELNCIVVGELIKNGVPAFPFQCSSHAVMNGKKLDMIFSGAAEGLVSIGMVPVAFGVPAYDMVQKCSILSGDSLAPFFALSLHANKIIHATDVDGVFTADPKKDISAKLVPLINGKNFDEVKSFLSGSSSTDVTGGMQKKIEELADLSKLGIESVIINGTKPARIKSAMLCKEVEGSVIMI